jgi:hypothetical protein
VKIPVDSTFDHKDPYKTLGVAPSAATADIRKAYLELARRLHPNLFATDPEKYRTTTALMQDINAAYELLSDPAQREFWDRRHPVAQRVAPQAAPGRQRGQSKYFDFEAVHLIIRKYNEFVNSLRTAVQRQEAIRRIKRFQSSRAGTAYIRNLVTLHYCEVMDFLKNNPRISVYDDGLVEFMYLAGGDLFPGMLEVAPSSVFITYAYVVFQENKGKLPAGLRVKWRRARRPGRSLVRLRLPGPGTGSASTRPKTAKGTGAKVWEWLMAKPGSPRK